MKKLLLLLLTVCCIVAVKAETADYSNATLKAQYEEWHLSHKSDSDKEGYISRNNYILQIAPGASFYFDPQTYYVDSLKNDPNGRVVYDKAFSDALEEFSRTKADAFKIMEDRGLMPKGRYKCRKDFNSGDITVWNSNGADKYSYKVPMDELVWELGDSTINVMGYTCYSATADYHGRKWTAWYTTELPMQDGPWQLCGLPGLIMKADSMDGEYGFEIKGLQKCDEPLKIPFEIDKTYATKRKTYLKIVDHNRRNRASTISAMTGGKVTLSDKVNYKGNDDFLETDYHE